ncbi:WXG100 family type VII secretion target [Rummeliibacillus pycnus]|uniref:WXG100 family type VII secretion target n=1 Tax=Rummeliibacillus pycnus TaxID=101070 RepID=UPI000C9A63BD|nr:WXG100 family type VII secretion target [Rummeliibacillus pycnus]
MSQNVEINGSRLKEAIEQANIIKRSLYDSKASAEGFSSTLSVSQWSGKAKDEFQIFLDIIIQYHDDICTAADQNVETLENLKKHMDELLNEAIVKDVEGIG